MPTCEPGVRRVVAFAVALAAAGAGATVPASAIPYFAREYGMACQKCHAVVPRLNAFGNAFMEHGYQLPGAVPRPAFPVAGKLNLAYTSEPDPTGLPKAIVDEVELFLAGTVGKRTNYFIEQYVVDGGRPGSTRDAWLQYRFTRDTAHVPVTLRAGSFTLPLPIDPETFRETSQHYTVWDQTVGNDPFDFFSPKIGADVRVGSALHGLQAHVLALEGHDQQSGIPSFGTDTMAYVQDALGPVTVSAYRYDGSRPGGGGVADRFRREGAGLVYAAGRIESDTVLQSGYDSNADGDGRGALSSGGFTQFRYEFDRRLFALVRYEGTNDPFGGFTRDLVPLLGYRVTRNSRATVEDVIRHAPQTTHTLNVQYTVAY